MIDIATGKFLNKTADTDEVNEGLVIPLIMQNKPPVELEDDKLSDLPFRPDEVNRYYIMLGIFLKD